MQTYDLTLIIDREPTDAELESIPAEVLDAAGVVGFETDPAGVLVHVVQDAATLVEAIIQAVHEVENLGQFGLRVAGVYSDDLVSVRDIATRTYRTYESVRLLAAGQRGPGGFPAPLSTGQWALYSWAEVSAWFAMHYGTEEPEVYGKALVAADHVIRARRILADDEQRDDLSKLLVVT